MANFNFKKITLPNGDVGTVTDVTAQNAAADAADAASAASTAAAAAQTTADEAKSAASAAQTTANSKTANSITMNGSSNANPTFYAATTVGTSGYYLKSNGSGAPTWAAVSSGPDIVVNATQPTGQKSGDFWYQVIS